MNNFSKLNLLYFLSIICYTTSFYAQNACESTLSNAFASTTAVCDGEYTDLFVTIENPSDDGTLNWYNANTNDLIENTHKVFLYAGESTCSVVNYQFYAVYSSLDCEDVISDTISVSVYPPIEGSIENNNCSVTLISECEGYATNWVDSQGNTGTGNIYMASSSGEGMVTFTMYDANNDMQVSCNSAIFAESYVCESCDSYGGALSSADDIECVVGIFTVQTTGLINENYDYHYAVVDENDNLMLLSSSANVDFTNIPTGNYCIYGISSLNSENINTDVVSINNLFDANACFDISDCLNVTKVETPNYIVSTEPTCNGDGTFNIGFTITNESSVYQINSPSITETVIALSNIEMILTFPSGSHGVSIIDVNAPECLAPSIVVFSQSCGDECPGSDEQLQANSLHICSGEMLNLNLHFVDTIENINWFAFEGGIPNATTTGSLVANSENLSFTASNCEIVEHNFTANYPIVIDGCFYTKVLYAKVFVYPKITVSGISDDNCMIELSQDCDNFTATWEDSFGNNGIGFNYDINNSNAAGSVSFSIHSGFVDGSGCDLEMITQTFDCSANAVLECPSFENVTASKNEMCDGEVLSLNAMINNDDGGNLTWFRADNNSFVSNPNAFVLQENICESTIFSFYATYESSTNNCDAIVSQTIDVIAHPIFNPTIEAIDCQVILTSNCESFDISWTDSQLNSGEGNIYNAITTEGFLTFQAHLNGSSSNDVANNCVSSWTYNAAFACESPIEPENPICPEIEQPETMETDLCSGNVFSLHWFNQTATWFDETGNEVENASGFILALPFGSCEMEYFDYYYEVGTVTQDAACGEDVTLIQRLRIAVYPQISATIIEENECQISLTQDCDNFTAVWQDSNGNTGIGFDYLAAENNSGTVSFEISSTQTNCTIFVETANFNCEEIENPTPECPEIEQPETIETDLCSGNVFSLHWFNQTATWFDEAGNEVENAGGFILALPFGSCEMEYFDYYYEAGTVTQDAACGEDVTLIQRLRIAVYPQISATIIEENECQISLTQDCDIFTAVWQDSNGNVGVGFDYLAAENTSGTVSFQVSSILTNCNIFIETASFNCEETENPTLECPEISQPEMIETDICGGEVFSLHWFNQTETWFDEAGNEVENPGGFVVEAIAGSCETQYFDYYYVAGTQTQPTECGETITLIQNLRLAVYPKITATVVEQTACSIALNQDCDNFFAIWQDANGNVGLGFEYEASENTSGTVTFQITDLATGCLPPSFSFDYTCGEAVDLPTEICDFPVLSTCVEPNESADICIFCEDEQEITITSVVSQNDAASFNVQQSCFSLTPFASFNNTIDSVYIEYCLTENMNVCSATSLVLTIGCTPNMPPIAGDDFYLTMSDIIILDLTINDSDPDNDAIQVSGFTPPDNGTLLMSDGIITYIPDLGFIGTEEIIYQLCDEYGNCTTGNIFIEVMASDCETTTYICTEPVVPTLICPEFCDLPANADVYIADAQMTFSCSLHLPPSMPTCLEYTALPLFVGTETLAIIGCDANTGICDTAYVVVQVTGCDNFEEDENIETTIDEEDNNENDGEILDDFVDGNNTDVENEVVDTGDNGTGKDIENVETSSLELLKIYPMPTKNELNIVLETTEKQQNLSLYDLNARLIFEEKRATIKGKNYMQIDIADLPKGIYMLSIENDKEQIIQKIVKQ
ncbi:MAG: T9SS type A sorting domain-containing protein [Chitinophagales bacterium]